MSEIAISVVLPCFRKFEDFCLALPHNHLFLDSRVEVVLVLDENSEEMLFLGLVKGFWKNHIRFRVIVNDEKHEWRPPCKAINVGIRNSLGQYCVVMSPESILLQPRPAYVFEKIHEEKFRKFYLTGILTNVQKADLTTDFNTRFFDTFVARENADGFGFILFDRQEVIGIGGYDERRSGYGKDDDDIRIRLQRNSVKHVNSSQLRVAHIWTENHVRREGAMAEPVASEIVLPNADKCGTSFGRVSFDWRKSI